MTAHVLASDIYVLVTAHPDDESMFFLPTIRCLQDKGCDLRLLCLTTGNYGGLGKIRSRELQKTCHDILDIQNVSLIDDPLLKDHPTQSWPLGHTVRIIETYLRQVLSSTRRKVHVITFDLYGVSGHINHRDTFLAAQALCNKTELPLEVWSLTSVRNPVIKYLPLYNWCLLVLHWLNFLPAVQSKEDERMCRVYRLHTPGLNWRAMASHTSQWVWYRKLFVLFSCYTFMNHLERISKKDL